MIHSVLFENWTTWTGFTKLGQCRRYQVPSAVTTRTLIPTAASVWQNLSVRYNKQVRINAGVICRYHLTQVWGGGGEGSEGAGRACIWGWRVSLSWVMAESSRWCSLEQIGFPHVVTKGGYRVMNKVCKLKPQWSDWIEYIKTGERISSQMSVFGKNRKMLASCVDVFIMKVCAGEVVDSKALGQTAFWDEQSKPWKKARNP